MVKIADWTDFSPEGTQKMLDAYNARREKRFAKLAKMTAPPARKHAVQWMVARCNAQIDRIRNEMASMEMNPADE